MSDDEQQESLRALEAHGRQFLDLFDWSSLPTNKRKPSLSSPSRRYKKSKREVSEDTHSSTPTSDTEEEWNGFSSADSDDNQNAESSGSSLSTRPTTGPDVVVFTDYKAAASTSSTRTNKAQQKAFMSSKVSKLAMNIPDSAIPDDDASEDGDELTNAQNDALLHRLVHTQILAVDVDSQSAAKRRKALAGRVLEVAGTAKLGKGETAVRVKEYNKNAKHVRDGILAKRKEQSQKELEEAKHMGNYHPALKGLFNDDSGAKAKPKRERGLRMGVGNFSGGVLRLSQNEIDSVTSQSRKPYSRKGDRKGGRRK